MINKNIAKGIGIIASCVVLFPFIYSFIHDSLPYCVTHMCGCTHNFGLADVIWGFTPLIAVVWIVIGGTFVITGLREKPSKKGDQMKKNKNNEELIDVFKKAEEHANLGGMVCYIVCGAILVLAIIISLFGSTCEYVACFLAAIFVCLINIGFLIYKETAYQNYLLLKCNKKILKSLEKWNEETKKYLKEMGRELDNGRKKE